MIIILYNLLIFPTLYIIFTQKTHPLVLVSLSLVDSLLCLQSADNLHLLQRKDKLLRHQISGCKIFMIVMQLYINCHVIALYGKAFVSELV